jgi:hypothetical protein
MSTAAYITALTIGMFAVLTVSANAAQEQETTEKLSAPTVVITDPLIKYKDAKSLTDAQLIELLSAVGFKGSALKVAWAVTKKESGGRPVAHNKNASTGDNSYGLFQINMIGDLGVARRDKFNITTNDQLFDPVTNAQVALHMTDGGKDWGAWGLGPNAYDGTSHETKISELMKDFPKSSGKV